MIPRRLLVLGVVMLLFAAEFAVRTFFWPTWRQRLLSLLVAAGYGLVAYGCFRLDRRLHPPTSPC